MEHVTKDRNITIYTTRTCPFCLQAKELLDDKGLTYTEICVEGNTELRSEMISKANRMTVPQIFVDDVHIGDCEDMYDLESQGKLDKLLGLK